MGVHFLTRHRNPLAYPAGIPPGFDPNHLASTGKFVFSAVAQGGNLVSPKDGKTGVLASTPVPAVYAINGPATVFDTSADYIEFSGMPQNSPTFSTIAGIIQFIGVPGAANQNIFYEDNTIANGVGVRLNTSAKWTFIMASVAAVASTFASAVAGVPYFYAISHANSSHVNFVVARLDSGQVYAETVSSASTALTSSVASCRIGNNNASAFSNAGISCKMFSRGYLSITELLAWAEDPWSFWYPNPGDNWYGASAAAPGGLFKITGNPRSLAGFGGGLAA